MELRVLISAAATAAGHYDEDDSDADNGRLVLSDDVRDD